MAQLQFEGIFVYNYSLAESVKPTHQELRCTKEHV